MLISFKKQIVLVILLTFSHLLLFSQEENVLKYVNPFIGTTKTKITSMWGVDGGTYPGAVAPNGFVQLTPETGVTGPNGYNYYESSIFCFSCINHSSGYPNGSSGSIYIMPLEEGLNIVPGKYSRPFLKQDEKSEPGYYHVLFRDNGTLVEVTASERTGMFRFTFPPSIKPKIFLGDIGKIETKSKRLLQGLKQNTIVCFNEDFVEKTDITGGSILTFPSSDTRETILILKIGVSTNGFESTQMNLNTEADTWDFDKYKEKNQKRWADALSIIEVDDTSRVNKTIFYTALYHSFLIPWIISDVKGNYKGADGQIHNTKGQNQYGLFSAWDTFRSLHPLLCLLAPDRQNDMILSMLDQFEQTGRLPKGPMTGYHAIPIIVDSYMKGIRGFDSTLAYKAMKASLALSYGSSEMSAYLKLGYVPSVFAESVTKTVEYAYDDWTLAQFAGNVMKEKDDYRQFLQRSYNYRNLFDSGSLFLLPRNGNKFIPEPGNFGYKEGDKWSYSLFIPQNPRDLINLSGGNNEFTSHLDSALTREYIVFDNEPILHVPYLFNYAQNPYKTQKWVRNIMRTHYKESADGLPGNDDLGAMSSWYVFSAMGFFPVCPGRPFYDIGSPIFRKVTLHLKNGKNLIIQTKNNGNDNFYIKSMSVNGTIYNKSWISHSTLTGGAEISFIMDKVPEFSRAIDTAGIPQSETKHFPDFKITDFNLSRNQVEPDEQCWVKFSLSNNGSYGTKIVRLYIDGNEYAAKNILAGVGSFVKDSIEYRLYPVGKRMLRIDNLKEKEVEVVKPAKGALHKVNVADLKSSLIFKNNESKDYYYVVRNLGGYRDSSVISVYVDDSVYQKDFVVLDPGETKKIVHHLMFNNAGLHNLRAGSAILKLKTYETNSDAKIIDLSMHGNITGDTIYDKSGLSNHGLIIRENVTNPPPSGFFRTDKNYFVELKNSASLDNLGEKITIMAWVYPTAENKGLTGIITKGDFIALQATGNRTLSFFAGGWGRGECTVHLPGNWENNWHHIAGVSDGNMLKIYIDGKEAGNLYVGDKVNLSSPGKWNIGRNEEFPNERIFNGYIDHFKVFVEPLTSSEIEKEMKRNLPVTE